MNSLSGNTSTICAVSTPPGRGGIAVIRVSGPDSIIIVDKLWRGKHLGDVPSHTAHLGHLVDSSGNVLDQALVTVFRTPRSYTGEDVVELSLHGSTYIQRSALDAIISCGAHVAEPGEFTRRAFINGRMDLAEAEAVADMIASSSRAAHSLAICQLQGHFSSHINLLRSKLIDLAALLELELDFSEEDVQFADRAKLLDLANDVITQISTLTDTFASGQAIREGVPVAIVGRPNAGKSSLMNALVGTDRAIVSDIPGTTRDTIEDTVDIKGITFRFIDTAGLRQTDDPVESLGIERAYSSLSNARIILWLIDPDISVYEIAATLSAINKNKLSDSVLIPILSKCDINSGKKENLGDYLKKNPQKLSVKTGEGLSTLRQTLFETASEGLPSDESLIVTNARHHSALIDAAKALKDLIEGINILTPDLLAEHMRQAIEALGTITGQITSDTLLHTIFSRFCIGK